MVESILENRSVLPRLEGLSLKSALTLLIGQFRGKRSGIIPGQSSLWHCLGLLHGTMTRRWDASHLSNQAGAHRGKQDLYLLKLHKTLGHA
jgi:hypothetical protein